MDITIYLPDQLARRAKEASGLNLSRMLRDALTQHFHEEDTMTQALTHAKTISLDIDDKAGTYRVQFDGIPLAENVFLTDEGKVIVYDERQMDYSIAEYPEEALRDQLTQDEYIEVMNALGITPTVALKL